MTAPSLKVAHLFDSSSALELRGAVHSASNEVWRFLGLGPRVRAIFVTARRRAFGTRGNLNHTVDLLRDLVLRHADVEQAHPIFASLIW